MNLILNECRDMWSTKAPAVTGVVAVHIRRFVTLDGMRGAGGVVTALPTVSNAGSQLEYGELMVTDNAFRLPSSTLPPDPDRPDPFDKTLGHELAHALTLDHGNGVDDPIDGVLDGIIDGPPPERDATQVFCTFDACLTEPFADPRCQQASCTPDDRRSSDNLMQYRFFPLAGLEFFRANAIMFTPGQCERMRQQAINHIPDRQIDPEPTPLANSAVDTLGEAAAAHADIAKFGIAVDPKLAVSYFVASFGALFPQNLKGLQVFFLVDTDNNPATGGDTRFIPEFPEVEGVELAVRVGLDATNGVASPVATVFESTGDVEFPFRNLVDSRISAEVTTQTMVVCFEDPETRLDVANDVAVRIPTELMPQLGVNARLQVMTQTAEGSPIDDATEVLTFETPEFPFCEVIPAAADRGERVVINAAGLPSAKEVHVLLGTGAGEIIEVARGFTIGNGLIEGGDGAGQVSLPFNVPQGVASGMRLVTVGLTDPNDARTADCFVEVREGPIIE